MKFSTKTTYGLRAMIFLALHSKKGVISLADIAESENISQGYLEKIFTYFKKAKLVKSDKGVKGGYRLAKSPPQITIFEIIEALEGKSQPFHCFGESGKMYCGPKCNCEVSYLFEKIQKGVAKTLKSVKLSELIK